MSKVRVNNVPKGDKGIRVKIITGEEFTGPSRGPVLHSDYPLTVAMLEELAQENLSRILGTTPTLH